MTFHEVTPRSQGITYVTIEEWIHQTRPISTHTHTAATRLNVIFAAMQWIKWYV